MRTLIRTAGRLLLSGIFVYSGYGMLNNAERYAKLAAAALPMIPEDPLLARVQGATMMAGGSTLALGFMPKTVCPCPRADAHPQHPRRSPVLEVGEARRAAHQLVHFLKNAGLMGGLLYISADKRTKPEPED